MNSVLKNSNAMGIKPLTDHYLLPKAQSVKFHEVERRVKERQIEVGT
jgi:hypothetical protein